jgi:hypothetical protein
MADRYFSVNRAVEYAALRGDFEEHIFFSTGKIGYIIFSDTLENVTAAIADSYVEKGYHVGFLNDTSDAAQAYAVPNAQFRAYLRGLDPAVDNLQKMISHPQLLVASPTIPNFESDIADLGLNWFVNVQRYIHFGGYPGVIGKIPEEIGNLKYCFADYRAEFRFSGCQITGGLPKNITELKIKRYNLSACGISDSIPREYGNFVTLEQIYFNSNNLVGVIPAELGNLIALKNLHLELNSLEDYESGSISTSQAALIDVNFSSQLGTATNTGIPSASIDQIIIDMADNVLINGQLNGTLNVSGNYPATAASITDAVARFGDISAKAYLVSKGWTVTHS